MEIYCCGCKATIEARLTDGSEIYPHRRDLHKLPFWKCDNCNNYVGCHHRSKNRTRPLGVIPTPYIREIRAKVHQTLDPLWKSGRYKRGDIYARLTNIIGKEYHTANISSVDEARTILKYLQRL